MEFLMFSLLGNVAISALFLWFVMFVAL